MEQTFNSKEYFKDLALEIIQNFEKANKATTPVLVGIAKETAVRKKLENIFPSSIGIGTGCIIDTFGHTSKQTDIIIYEKEICPIFSLNETEESTYYPCEGVIAIGEVKSILNTKELTDSINKIESVKKAKRESTDTITWRSYGSRQNIRGTESERYDPINKDSDEIFGFVLCEKFGLKPKTLLDKYIKLIKSKDRHLVPNLIVSINDGLITFIDKPNNKVKNSIRESTDAYLVNCYYGNFQFLLTKLDQIIKTGRSVSDLPFSKYITESTNLSDNGISKPI